MADRWASLRARAPVTVVFVVAGLSAGTWAARIPAIKAGLNLSPGVLGLCLLGPAVGSVLTMPLAGAIIQGLTAWAHEHDITEGQLAVLTIDPVPPGTEPQGLIFWIIPLTR